jgi:hypothetical protein
MKKNYNTKDILVHDIIIYTGMNVRTQNTSLILLTLRGEF